MGYKVAVSRPLGGLLGKETDQAPYFSHMDWTPPYMTWEKTEENPHLYHGRVQCPNHHWNLQGWGLCGRCQAWYYLPCVVWFGRQRFCHLRSRLRLYFTSWSQQSKGKILTYRRMEAKWAKPWPSKSGYSCTIHCPFQPPGYGGSQVVCELPWNSLNQWWRAPRQGQKSYWPLEKWKVYASITEECQYQHILPQ